MGSFYTPGKTSTYWEMIDILCDKNIFDKDPVVLPFTPKMKQTFVDFVDPTYYPAGTILDVYLNHTYVMRTSVSDDEGLITFDIDLPYSRGVDFTLNLKLTDGTPVKSSNFKTYNLYTLYESIAELIEEKLLETETVKNNKILSTAEEGVLYTNFGVYFDLQKRFDQTYFQYRDVLESFYIAFMNAGTIKGIITAIEDLTGFTPTIENLRDRIGWRIYDYYKYTRTVPAPGGAGPYGLAGTVVDNDPTREHMHLEDGLTALGNLGWVQLKHVKPYSIQEKSHGVAVIMQASQIAVTVTNEPVSKGGDGISDSLANKHLTSGLVNIPGYSEMASPPTAGFFSVDRTNGIIEWPAVGAQPTAGTVYYVTYVFSLIDAIEKVIRQLKPAFKKITLEVI